MGIVVLGGAVIVLLALAFGGRATAGEKCAALPPEFQDFLKKRLGKASAEEIERMAVAAEKAGCSDTADTLRKKAIAIRSLGKPPFPEANPLGWRKFVQLLGSGPPSQITPGGYYGAFALGARRLSDLGLVLNVRKGEYQGRQVWTGDWKPPLSGTKFLSDYDLQYATFVRSMADYRAQWNKLKQMNPELFKIKVNGSAITLSGFLALCHRAGLAGAIAFLRDPSKRLSRTVAFVKQVNGIF